MARRPKSFRWRLRPAVKVRGDRLLWIDVDLEAPDSAELFAAVAERAEVEPHAAERLLTLRGKPHADDHGELLRVEVVGLNLPASNRAA